MNGPLRIVGIGLCFILLASACGSGEPESGATEIDVPEGSVVTAASLPSTTSSTPDATTAPPESSTTTVAPTTTSIPVTTDADLTARGHSYGVVLVSSADGLNVRSGPGVSNPVLTEFRPDQNGIEVTGSTAVVDGGRWVEVRTEDGLGWSSNFYLAESFTPAEVGATDAFSVAVAQLDSIIASGGDLTAISSSRGLFVAHHDGVVRRYRTNELAGLLESTEQIDWESPACGSNCAAATFAASVGSTLRAAYAATLAGSADTPAATDVPAADGFVPPSLQNFPWLRLLDLETDDGLAWRQWLVFFDWEQGQPRIVGLAAVEGPESSPDPVPTFSIPPIVLPTITFIFPDPVFFLPDS